MSWHAKRTNGYSHSDTEAQENALEIWTILGSRGWTKNAVCGLLGNFAQESGYNPWRWESNVVLSSTDPRIDTSRTNGYGLGQFTPAGKYIHSQYSPSYPGYGPNFADITGDVNDGNAQILFIDEHADYYPTTAYPWSYSEYKAKTESSEIMTRAWFANYERGDPSVANMPFRISEAAYWYMTLPNTPPGPTPTERKGMPLWMKIFPYNF